VCEFGINSDNEVNYTQRTIVNVVINMNKRGMKIEIIKRNRRKNTIFINTI
jgi:hypothetical protein